MLILISCFICSCITQVLTDCLDINGRSIAQDLHYVPGPDACTLCICEQGLPKLCKAVLCAPPQDCQSFTRVGKSCCNFTCNDALHNREEFGTDLGLRLLLSVVAAILSLTLLFFLVHRLRQRKTLGRRSRALHSDRRSLGNIGYITGSLSYLPENYFATADGFDRHIEFRYEEPPSQLSLWKPPGHTSTYYPRGEAPPPYEVAVAQPRAELTITASSTLPNISHRTIPLNLTAPGTIRIIHPHQRRAIDSVAATTLPRAPGKAHDAPTGTLQINISSCGFHGALRQSEDAAVQSSDILPVITPPAVADVAIGADTAFDELRNLMPMDRNDSSPSLMAEPCNTVQSTRSSRDSPLPEADPPTDDNDDYRSECENCKCSPGGPGYYADPDGDPDPPETMTLQRLPKENEEEPFYRTSLTLPTHCRQPRRVLGSRENWFSAMPESSSEED